MAKNRQEDPEVIERNLMFQQWFRDNWMASGGLITKRTAARFFNVTPARITYLIRKGFFKVRRYENLEFLEMPPIMVMQHHQNYKYLREKLDKETELMPEEQRESFRDMMLKIYDKLDNQINPIDKSKEIEAARNITSITKAAEPQDKTSTKKTAKSAGRPRTPEGKRGKGKKKL